MFASTCRHPFRVCAVLLTGLLTCSCRTVAPPGPVAAYTASGDESALYFPVFLIEGNNAAHNRIGKPSVRYVSAGTQAYVDPDRPVIYWQRQSFTTARDTYTNEIYRVHFEKVPLRWHLTGGRNVGLLVIATFNSKSQPVLITSVHTCGCFLAVVPTSFLPADARPADWDVDACEVYGETLPGLIDFDGSFDSSLRPVLTVRPEIHRVRDLSIGDVTPHASLIQMETRPMSELERLPLAESDATSSFFYTHGRRQGYVKNSKKPFEMLLMGWWVGDLYIGRDKAFGPAAETGTRFYTSTKFWQRKASDLWNFNQCLEYYGWNL